MSENDPSELTAGREPLGSDGEEILILRHHHSTQIGCSVEQYFVIGSLMGVFLSRHHVNALSSETGGNLSGNLLVEVKCHTHGSSP
jgi:hypothetical protein